MNDTGGKAFFATLSKKLFGHFFVITVNEYFLFFLAGLNQPVERGGYLDKTLTLAKFGKARKVRHRCQNLLEIIFIR